MHRRGAGLSLVYLTAMLFALPLYFLVGDLAQRAIFYGFGFSSVAAIVIGIRTHRPEHAGPWVAFAGALLLFALGDVVFDLYALHGGVAPIPSVADVLYIGGYPVLAIGMVLLVRYRAPGRDLVSALDGAIVTIAVGVLAWALVVSPYTSRHELALSERLVSVAYPMFDLLVLAVVVRLLLSGGRHCVAYGLVAMSVLALLVSDGFYTVATMHGTYGNGSLVDAGWMLSYALFGAAALHPSMHQVTTWASSRRPPWRAVLAILGIAALAPIALLIYEHVRRGDAEILTIAVCSSVIVALVLARIGVLTHALDHAFRAVTRGANRQQVLTTAALAMVASSEAQTIADAAVRAAIAAAGSGSWAVYVACDTEVPSVAASAGPGAPEHVDSDIAAMIDRDELLARPIRVIGPDERTNASLRFVVPVTVALMLRAVVVIGAVDVDVDEFMPTVELLASELTLALQAMDAAEVRHLMRTERLFGGLIRQSSDVVTLVGADLVVRYQSPSVQHVLGVAADAFTGRSLADLVHPDDLESARAAIARIVEAGSGSTGRIDARVRHGDGSWRDADTVVTNLLGTEDVDAIVLNSRDVTERRELERQLRDQALHDRLTRLPNRALFLDRVRHALSRAGRSGETVAVLFADLDDFQAVNDSLGHPAGDRLLETVAQRLLESVRPGDTIARLGGDEFAVLLEDGDIAAAAEVVARRIAASLRPPIELAEKLVSIHASVGIAFGTAGEQSADELLRNADLAMYVAKRRGKDRYELFSPSMHERAVERLAIAADLRDALARDELIVFYQPIVDIETGALCAAEALVRWNHPRRGFLGPDEFIPVAEATGLVVALDRFVLDQACRQVQAWRREGAVDESFYVSVNLSGRQIQEATIVDDVQSALRESGLPAGALVLEVTESAVMGDLDIALPRLRALKSLGLRLAVDDFGTGYSSLSYISELPVDLIKIDKSFVDQLDDGPDGTAMVRAVLDLGRARGLTAVAEGIETEDQLQTLALLGCHKGQGYLLGMPMHSVDMMHVLERLRGGQPLHVPVLRRTLARR